MTYILASRVTYGEYLVMATRVIPPVWSVARLDPDIGGTRHALRPNASDGRLRPACDGDWGRRMLLSLI